MRWQYTSYSYLLILAATVAGMLALYAWRRRRVAGAKMLTLFLVAVCWWEAVYVLEISAGGLQTKILWAKIEYLGIVMVPLFWLAFALEYTGRESWLTRRNFLLLAAPLITTLVLVFTNEVHNLIWTRTALESHGTFSLLDVEYGAWFWFHWIYSLLLILLGTILLLRALPRSLRPYRRQSLALLVAAAIPWLSNVIYVLGLEPLRGLDLTPFAFLLSGVAMSLGLFYFGLLDLVPIAHDRVIEDMSDGMIVLDAQDRIVDLNPAAERALHIPLTKAVGQNIARLLPEVPLPGGRRASGESFGEVRVGSGTTRRSYDLRLSALETRRGQPKGHLLALRDVTERRRIEEEIRALNESLEKRVAERTEQLGAAVIELRKNELMLRQSEERFRSLVRHASDIVTILDADGTIRYESPSVEQILGRRPEELVGRNIFDYLHPDDKEWALGVFRGILEKPEDSPVRVQCRFRHADGFWRYLETSGTNQLDNPSIAGVVCNSRDVTERKVLEEQLERRAFYDSLTDLPNRTLFMDRLRHALSRVERQRKTVAVLFVDLDNFKVVNDSLGHTAGDGLLVEFARRLRDRLRPEDTAARFGGDEFAVLLEDLTDTSDAVRVVERILECLRAPFLLDNDAREVFITASIGVSGCLSDEGPEDLIRGADLAMYKAKSSGKAGYAIFDAGLDTKARERLDMESELRRAIKRGEIQVHYQPKVSLETDRIVGVEALARWKSPEGGMTFPATFIPLAEETGLIVPLGRCVLDEACRQLKQWQEHDPENRFLTMSVNLSPKQFLHPGLSEEVRNALRKNELDPETLVLEITENTAMEDTDSTISTLEKLKGLGVKLAMDDFGKGYSSLSYLRRFPVDCVKIDRTMIEGIEEDSGDLAIVWTVIMLAHALRLEAVAEGVENAGQVRKLHALKCDAAQGYYWWEPGPAETVERLLFPAAQ
jgi:diguanylate cyclase (GGDEF)-like protein/PAS domain S-box-containing protein